LVGATVSSIGEALAAVQDGANYLGIGTIFATPTLVNPTLGQVVCTYVTTVKYHVSVAELTISRKTDTKSIIGTAGAKQILAFLSTMPENVGTVAIGGINLANVQRVIYQSQATLKGLDGVAVVSAIMGSENPREAATAIAQAIVQPPLLATIPASPRPNEISALLKEVPELVRKVASQRPLCHNMINYVVANFAANVALSMYVFPLWINGSFA
jgi:thiamine-phosphate diphosphorylase/hydroxyethylthiazole kinase